MRAGGPHARNQYMYVLAGDRSCFSTWWCPPRSLASKDRQKLYCVTREYIVCLEENGHDITFINLFNGIMTHQFDIKIMLLYYKISLLELYFQLARLLISGRCGWGCGIKYQNQPCPLCTYNSSIGRETK